MLDAWAGSRGIRLYPGTANACSSQDLTFPQYHSSLSAFQHLFQLEQRRRQPGFAPRLYHIRILIGAHPVFAWIFRWSENDSGLGFVGDTLACQAARSLEIVAMVGVRADLGLSDGDEFHILLPEAAA